MLKTIKHYFSKSERESRAALKQGNKLLDKASGLIDHAGYLGGVIKTLEEEQATLLREAQELAAKSNVIFENCVVRKHG